MGSPLHVCEKELNKAVAELFDADAQIQAVGIARHDGLFGFKAVKNKARILPSSARRGSLKLPKNINEVPVTIESVTADIEPQMQVLHPLAASFVPEQQLHRPLVCGLQVQNVDDDDRQRHAGQLGAGRFIIGTLGGFVKFANGSDGLLSNNHVLAGENRGRKGRDRILQSGSLAFTANEHIATLTNFITLNHSPNNARPASGNVVFNDVDAAVAQLESTVSFLQGFLPVRQQPVPQGSIAPQVGAQVFKIGRTTGLTHGIITAIGTVVGPIPYAPGPCWFQNQFEIVGTNGTMFSDHGDSGSLILSTTGDVIGLLYAGNGTHTYACPIQAVLRLLKCRLA